MKEGKERGGERRATESERREGKRREAKEEKGLDYWIMESGGGRWGGKVVGRLRWN